MNLSVTKINLKKCHKSYDSNFINTIKDQQSKLKVTREKKKLDKTFLLSKLVGRGVKNTTA